MRNIIGAILAGIVVVILTACGGSRPVKYYTLGIPGAPDPAAADRIPVSLLISHIRAPEILRDDRVVYRNGSNELGTYEYHRWAEPPALMIESVLLRMLRSSGKYRSASQYDSISQGNFVLRGKLYDFEEVDGNSITARVAMEFELQQMSNGDTVWTHFYSHDEPVNGRTVSQVVEALDRNLQRGLADVTNSLEQYFQKKKDKNY